MTTLLQHTKSELRAAGLFDDDSDFDGEIGVQVMALMETFCAYGHSGGSAAITLVLFDKLAHHLPINPLTGEDGEWDWPEHVEDKQIMVNKRCSRVFKDDEMAWDTHVGRTPITFPYMPE